MLFLYRNLHITTRDKYFGYNLELLPFFICKQEEEFALTKRVIRICKSTKNRQHNGQKKKVQRDKQRSTQHTYKTKDRVTRTPLKTGDERKKTILFSF